MTFRTLAADAALDEYARLVAVLENRSWRTPDIVSEATGRPVHIGPQDYGNSHQAAHRVMDEAMTDAIAECLSTGVTRADLTNNRGWLSHNDINRLVLRAAKPTTTDIRTGWPQAQALRGVQKTLSGLRHDHRTVEADRLARSARTFLRQWATTIPTTPPPEKTVQVAAVFRRDHVNAWRQARSELLAEIRNLVPATPARSGPVADVTPRA